MNEYIFLLVGGGLALMAFGMYMGRRAPLSAVPRTATPDQPRQHQHRWVQYIPGRRVGDQRRLFTTSGGLFDAEAWRQWGPR